MDSPAVTSWTIIHDASSGQEAARTEFAHRYQSIIRAYLKHRWRSGPLLELLDDAIQDVFVECFRAGGVLETVDPQRSGGFRAFFYGVIRNIALRVESKHFKKREHQVSHFIDAAADQEASLSQVFDQAWARMILKEAAKLQSQRAEKAGGEAAKRVELLQLRFEKGLPIRQIAELWQQDPAHLHRQYRLARTEFKNCLQDTLIQHHGGTEQGIEQEGERLLALFG